MKSVELIMDRADSEMLQAAQITYEARLNLLNHFKNGLAEELQNKLFDRYEEAFAAYELAKEYIIKKYTPEPNPASFNAVFATDQIVFYYEQ